MILAFTDEEVNIIRSNYVLHDMPPRHLSTAPPPVDDEHVNALMLGTSKDIGFVFISDSFITLDATIAGLYNMTKYLKKASIVLNWRYLYPQLKGNTKLKAERIIDYIVYFYKNIYIKQADVFPNNTFANQLLSYLIANAYDNEKRLIFGMLPREGSLDVTIHNAVGADDYAKQIIQLMYHVNI